MKEMKEMKENTKPVSPFYTRSCFRYYFFHFLHFLHFLHPYDLFLEKMDDMWEANINEVNAIFFCGQSKIG